MSYVPANENRDLPLIAGLIVATIVSTSVWLRADRASTGKIIGHCADGTVIGLWRDGVRRRPGRRPEERARFHDSYPDLPIRRSSILEDDLQPGELSFAALRLGGEGEAGWIIEGLDAARASLAIVWEFENDVEARAVLQRLEERIVRPPRDSAGLRIPVTEADLAAARERERMALDSPI